MLPILITTCIPTIMIAQASTLYIKQGTTLDRSMGPNFEIPPACLIAFINIFMQISVVIYDCVFVPSIRRYTKNPRGITMLQRFGIGLMIHIIIVLTTCLAERKRLSVARKNNLLGQHDTLPLTIFILLPQFALTGIADTFVDVAKCNTPIFDDLIDYVCDIFMNKKYEWIMIMIMIMTHDLSIMIMIHDL